MHDETGGQGASPANADRVIRHLAGKIEKNRDAIVRVRRFFLEDAEWAVIAFGCSARSARAAVREARRQGIPAGLLELTTLWPFPDDDVRDILSRVRGAVVPELNLGQAAGEVRRLNDFGIPVRGISRVDGTLIPPGDILSALREARS
jgi:2-oxoglutarate ferredoxin oxidoreductase subunit alpha